MSNSQTGETRQDFQAKRGTQAESRHAKDASKTLKKSDKGYRGEVTDPSGRTQTNKNRLNYKIQLKKV